MTQSCFTYYPLRSPDSIRLLLLQPAGAFDDILRGSLLYTTITERDENLFEPYTALSYVWGTSEKRRQINLDDHPVAITENLEDALRGMRDRVNIHRIWADALCIDQSNISERNHQVTIMGEIYANASHTIIHLGPSTPEIERVFRACRAAGVSKGDMIDSTVASCGDEGPATNEDMEKARQDVLSRQWFKRAWVFQELVMSPKPWVQCGTSRVRWDYLFHAFGPRNVAKAMRIPPVERGNARDQLLFSKVSQREGVRALAQLSTILCARRGIEATDARDEVFAYWGLISDRKRCESYISVDYDKNIGQVYNAVAAYILDADGIDTLLTHAMMFSRNLAHPDLAPWAPDWTCSDRVSDLYQRSKNLRYISYGGNSHSLMLYGVQFIIHQPPLFGFQAFQFDIINSMSLPFPRLGTSNIAPIPIDWAFFDEKLHKWSATSAFWDQFSCIVWEQAGQDPTLRASQRNFMDKFGGYLHNNLIPFIKEYLDGDQRSYLAGRRLAFSASGRIYVVPSDAREDDIVVLLTDSTNPVLLRYLPLGTEAAVSALNEEAKDLFRSRMGRRPRYVKSNIGFPDLHAWDRTLRAANIRHCSIVGMCFELVSGQSWFSLTSFVSEADMHFYVAHCNPQLAILNGIGR